MGETAAGRSEPARAARWDERERFIWRGAPRKPLGDLYHVWLDLKWRHAVLAVFAFYLVANLTFGAGYWLIGGIENAEPGSFRDAFFFSVQTFATIGYGKMAPVSPAANLLVTLEAWAGMLASAIATGMMFAKFARPTARMMFSRPLVITRWEGKPSLQFRLANERGNRIVEATLRVTLLRAETTREGVRVRRLYELPMVRERSAIFALTWTAIHVIDERSPLFGLSAKDLEAQQIELIVSVTGHDETFAATIHARHNYRWDDFRWGERLVDIVTERPDGRREIDYPRFHETTPDGLA